MPGTVVNPSRAARPARKAMSPRSLIAAHPELLGSKPSSTLSATLVKVYCGADCACASDSIAPSATLSPVKRARISARVRRTGGRLWAYIHPPCVDHARASSFYGWSLPPLATASARNPPVYTHQARRTVAPICLGRVAHTCVPAVLRLEKVIPYKQVKRRQDS